MAKPILVEFNGKIACLSEHCRDLGLDIGTLYSRQKSTGDSYEKCLEYYQKNGTGLKGCLINFNGKLANIQEHCKDLGISPKTLWGRKHRTNETYEECLAFFAKYGTHHRERTIKDLRFWNIWYHMIDRCHNPKHKSYKNYGGRGIIVCERWHKFEYFEADMYKAYLWHVSKYGEKDTSLDRIKNSCNYMENNCRWATKREQALNRKQREGKILMSTGETIAEFSKRTHIPKDVIRHRLHDGWTEEEIINTPIKDYKGHPVQHYISDNGNKIPLKHYCEQNNYNYHSICNYIYRHNISADEALAQWLKGHRKSSETSP